MSNFVEHMGVYSSFYSCESWTILNTIEQKIKNKIEEIGMPLKEWENIQINYGIKTGFNEAFLIDSNIKKELISADPKSAELIRPILRGRDIGRYTYSFSDLWLLYIPWHFPLHQDEIAGASKTAEMEFEKQYPAVYKHLTKYKKQLSSRNKEETGIRYEWYALQRWGAKYKDEFFKQKILFQEMIQEPSFVLDNDHHFFCLDTGRIITGSHLEYLVGLMNSKLFFYAVKKFYGGGALGSSGIRMKHTFFGEFPAIIPTDDEIEHFKKLYYSNEDHKTFDREIVSYLYSKYEFTQDEIDMIENTYNL